MAEQGRAVAAEGRSIVIFPEGTRKNPDAAPDYKPGVAGLYTQLGIPCVPVALNSGLFWTGPGGFVKKRGRVVIEFLPPISAGLKRAQFMRTLEQRTEEATAKLVAEGRALLARHN
jgi:1-acyl-sn-glycerol-3-phosphate acyltransferase